MSHRTHQRLGAAHSQVLKRAEQALQTEKPTEAFTDHPPRSTRWPTRSRNRLAREGL